MRTAGSNVEVKIPATCCSVHHHLGVVVRHRVELDCSTRAHHRNRLGAQLKKIRRYMLIIIDEVGYIPFDQDAANLFFQLIASRYEIGSIMVTSNSPLGCCGDTFSDDVVAAAMIDRLHHAEVLTLTGDSYRTRTRRELLGKSRTSNN